MEIAAELGDILQVPADGLVVALGPEGAWAGATLRVGDEVQRWTPPQPRSVEEAVLALAGWQYSEQAEALLGRPAGSALVARQRQPHPGAFQHVVFVLDDPRRDLSRTLTAALEA
ncbi:MAG: hypothetical protein AB1758_06145, partial [Candidatus Eremiobacterota bacterium]